MLNRKSIFSIISICFVLNANAVTKENNSINVEINLDDSIDVKDGRIIIISSSSDQRTKDPAHPDLMNVYNSEIESIKAEPGKKNYYLTINTNPSDNKKNICAYYNRNSDFMRTGMPSDGDYYSAVCNQLKDGMVNITINTRFISEEIKLPEWASIVELPVDQNANFKKIPMLIILPPSYKKSINKHYPVLYVSHGINGNHLSYLSRFKIWYKVMEVTGKEAIIVSLNSVNTNGHHQFVNSTENGPLQDILTKKLVPFVDTKYRTFKNSKNRGFYGQSSGGWAAMWARWSSPNVFGYAFVTNPDPLELESWWFPDGANNFYFMNGKPRTILDGILTTKNLVQAESKSGTSGQYTSFLSVFSSKDKNGNWQDPFDKETGIKNNANWEKWLEKDLYTLSKNNIKKAKNIWSGKTFLYVSNNDPIGLTKPARNFAKLLEKNGINIYYKEVIGTGHSDYVSEKFFLNTIWDQIYSNIKN